MDVQKYSGNFTGRAAGSVLLTLAAALALWLFIAANHRKAAIEDISKSLETINSYKTAEITAWLDDHNREALRLSRHPFLGGIISAELSKPGSRRAVLSTWLKDHTEQKQYASMAFISPDKKIIAATPDYRAETKEEFIEHLDLASKNGTAQVTDLYLATSGHPRIAMFSPITAEGRGGKPVCVLVIKMNLGNRFYPILKAAPLFFTQAETLLVRKEGENALFLNPLIHVKDSALKFTRPLSDERLPAAAALRGVTGFFQGVDYRGVKVFSAIGPVPGTNWAVITKVDRETVIAPAKYKEQLYLAVILLAAALLYFLVYAIIKARRRAAEAALERSRHLLAETEKIGKVGGWEFNIDTRKQIWTEEVYRIHELDPAFEPDVERGVNFYTPGSRPVIERAVENAMKTGEGFDLELEIITAKGNKRAVHAIGKSDLPNRRIYGFFQDITERRQAESERQKIERIFNEFMEHSPVYVFFKDKDLRSLHLSRNYEAMLGRPLKELLGKSMDELFPSDLAKGMIEDDKRIIREGKEVVVEEELNGRFYRTIKFPIKIEGSPSYLAGYTIDITETKLAEKVLRKSERELKEAQRLARIGNWEWDTATDTITWSEEYYRIYGLDPAQKPPGYEEHLKAYTQESAARLDAAVKKNIETGEPYELDLELARKEGATRWVTARSETVRDARGKVTGLRGTAQDITERKRIEEERLVHLRFFENMNRVDEATRGETDPERMMSSVLNATLKIFDSDRVWLFYPCDPEAPSFRVPMEVCKPEYPGAKTSNEDLPMAPDMARNLREALQSAAPVTYTVGTESPINKVTAERFGVKSQILTAIYPKRGKPWVFGMHQCSFARVWTTEEKGLMQEIGRRLADSMTSLLSHRDLQESELKLKDAQRLAHMGNWTLDLVSNKLSWSDEIYRIFELDPARFGASYEAFLEAIHPEDRELVNRAYTDSLKTKSPYNIVHRLLMRDGTIKYVNECCETYYDKEGRPLRSVGTVQDITERKLAEEKLRESEERLRITLDVTRIGTWDWNVETDTWSASPTYYTMLGYDPEPGPGDRQAWLDRVHPDDKDMIAGKIRGVLSGAEAKYQYEARIRHADGTYRWQAVLGKTVKRGQDGKAARIMGVRMDITERKLAEQKLRESEVRYRALVDASGDGILTADLETMKFRFANRAICRMLGYTAEELTNLAVTDIHPKEALPAVIAEFEAQARGEKTLAPNLPCLRKDGSVFHVDITTTPVTVDGRRCNLGIFRDITERKRNEELNGTRLHLMEFSAGHSMDEMLEEALNKAEVITGSLIGFYHFIEADQKTLWLQNWSTRTKRDFCSAEGKGSHYSIDRAGVWTDCVRARKPVIHNDYASLQHKKSLPPGHAAVIRELVLPVMRGDKVVAIMGVGNKASDYTEKDIEALSPLADLSWEIVNRKRAEEALRESERLLRESQRQAHLGSYALDVNTGLWRSSAELDGIFGIGETYQRSVDGWLAMVHPDDRAMMSAYFREEVIGRKRPFDKEYRIVRQDTGAGRWVHGLGGLEFDANGRPVEMHGTIQDIHERKLAELELERLNRDLVAKRQEMENFLYITSHDLRTPLVNIQGFAQNLENYLRELAEELSPSRLPREVNEAVYRLIGKEIPGALKFVLESSHKMDALITSLLKVARLGRVEMKPRDLDMNDTLKKVVDSTSYQLKEAGAAEKVGVLPPCKADPAAVSQIFTNLLDNAIKYRAADRPLSVTITGESRDASVLYKIADNGSGIAAKDLGRIWDIFYRGKGAGEGEGIGLTVVKYMAEKNGGSIRAESEEGRGTVFYLELPAAGGTK